MRKAALHASLASPRLDTAMIATAAEDVSRSLATLDPKGLIDRRPLKLRPEREGVRDREIVPVLAAAVAAAAARARTPRPGRRGTVPARDLRSGLPRLMLPRRPRVRALHPDAQEQHADTEYIDKYAVDGGGGKETFLEEFGDQGNEG